MTRGRASKVDQMCLYRILRVRSMRYESVAGVDETFAKNRVCLEVKKKRVQRCSYTNGSFRAHLELTCYFFVYRFVPLPECRLSCTFRVGWRGRPDIGQL